MDLNLDWDLVLVLDLVSVLDFGIGFGIVFSSSEFRSSHFRLTPSRL
jgi:hypothetical protein